LQRDDDKKKVLLPLFEKQEYDDHTTAAATTTRDALEIRHCTTPSAALAENAAFAGIIDQRAYKH
jgi:hypothetical protein